MSGFEGWSHLRTVLLVESETFDAAGRRTAHEHRYYLSSLPLGAPFAAALALVRLHWGVETAHQILDVAFAEDDHPWIESVPRARCRRRHAPAHRLRPLDPVSLSARSARTKNATCRGARSCATSTSPSSPPPATSWSACAATRCLPIPIDLGSVAIRATAAL
jgi:hypothetical protein